MNIQILIKSFYNLFDFKFNRRIVHDFSKSTFFFYSDSFKIQILRDYHSDYTMFFSNPKIFYQGMTLNKFFTLFKLNRLLREFF